MAENNRTPHNNKQTAPIITGAERTDVYLPLLQNMNIAVVSNHTSLVGKTHLVDTLVALGIRVKKIFSPEHGFRGDAAAGEHVISGVDIKTGLPVVSLYGNKKKPAHSDLHGIELVIYDIQDVGVRFYTYISTMTLMMEACAEQNIPVIIFDRPNPNGFYVDGPVLENGFESFVGMHPVPVVYGMTIGEYALMVNGEGWLKGGLKCELKVIEVLSYQHTTLYHLPVKPSPNLATMEAVYLYPSLCFFEGTFLSVGRGTPKPFQWVGHPNFLPGKLRFTPVNTPGAALNPVLIGQECRGIDYTFLVDSILQHKRLYLEPLIEAASFFSDNPGFFNSYFNILAGNCALQKQIQSKMSLDEIKKEWNDSLEAFHSIRKKYLLYPE
ncbi:MAG: DUF1343 domain-containing protein [Bacteroidales bacterium]|nr:DUF1343 domain-containing protein [Bacteroidales bacterium]